MARFSRLLREKSPEYVVEILVIIIGITLSFAVDEWKDLRQKRELEQVYLKSLLSDLEQDLRELDEVMEETRLVIDKGEELLDVGD